MHPITATTNAFLAPQALSLIIPPVPIFLSCIVIVQAAERRCRAIKTSPRTARGH